ncbi:hypothetical protein AKJ16_DCAP20002 [Drosera capensis]
MGCFSCFVPRKKNAQIEDSDRARSSVDRAGKAWLDDDGKENIFKGLAISLVSVFMIDSVFDSNAERVLNVGSGSGSLENAKTKARINPTKIPAKKFTSRNVCSNRTIQHS